MAFLENDNNNNIYFVHFIIIIFSSEPRLFFGHTVFLCVFCYQYHSSYEVSYASQMTTNECLAKPWQSFVYVRKPS